MSALSLETASALELAAAIRERRVSSREVVEAHLAVVARTNPALNAIVVELSDDARRRADEVDRTLATRAPEDLPPLFGVPCTIKESMGLAGQPQSAGLVARRHVRAPAHATTVARLLDAGAIPLGLTNVSELLMWMESDNRVYGRSNNAYDPARTCGGSSGGEGASIGAGMAPFGLGADIGGSIRIPAFFNGVFGHKPTGGLVPATGQYPCAVNDALRYLTTGPLARRASDLGPLLRILAGPDGHDAACRSVPIGDETAVDVARLTVLDVSEPASYAVSADLAATRARAVESLAKRGAKVKKVSFPALKKAIPIWAAMLEAAGGETFSELLGDGTPVRVARELALCALGRSDHTFPALGLALLEKVPKLLGSGAAKYVALGHELRRELHDALGADTVMPYPPHATVAPRHGRAMLPPLRWGYTAIFNLMETPSTAVPMGLDAEGVPLGVQIVAGPWNDHLCLAVARALEEDHGGWVPPPLR
jgi:fatty acid amide hydrolase 2